MNQDFLSLHQQNKPGMSSSALTKRTTSGAIRKKATGTSRVVTVPATGTINTLVVFGGTGFVGSAVLASAVLRDPSLQILVITRRGLPPAWFRKDVVLSSKRLHFLAGDLLQPQSVTIALIPWTSNPRTKFVGCISCVGCITPWNQKKMVSICGDANIQAYLIYRTIAPTAKFAVITRDRTNWDDWWYPFPLVLPGYYEGKRKIENFISNDIENRGNAVCFRAGFVVGTRRTIPGLSNDLPVYIPMQWPCKLVNMVCPTIDVDELGDASVRFVLSPQTRKSHAAVIENEEIPSFFDDES